MFQNKNLENYANFILMCPCILSIRLYLPAVDHFSRGQITFASNWSKTVLSKILFNDPPFNFSFFLSTGLALLKHSLYICIVRKKSVLNDNIFGILKIFGPLLVCLQINELSLTYTSFCEFLRLLK